VFFNEEYFTITMMKCYSDEVVVVVVVVLKGWSSGVGW
jgi:hypothetical protein